MKHTFLTAAMKRPNTDDEEPRLLHEFFERQVKLRPDHPAVECNGEVLTYSELDAAANRVAMSLRSRGVRSGSLVALCLEKSCGLFAVLLGILKAGAGYVPIDPKSPVARIESILQDANVAAVISEGDLAKRLEFPASPEVLILGKALARSARSAQVSEPVVVIPSDTCYVIYTSGSTGRPKGVIIEHRNAVNFVRALRTVYKLSQDDRVYQGFSIAFDASIEEIWGTFSVGGTLVVPSAEIARSTFDAAEFIDSRGITFFSTVPSFLAAMKTELRTVRLLVLGGEVCPPELVNRFAVSGRRMLNTYGPTEATVVATTAECVPGEPVTIGTALPGYVTYVLDEQMRRAKPGESGELYIGGDSIARGYMNQPELTAERFLLNPFADQGSEPSRIYRTQDLVRLTENERLQCCRVRNFEGARGLCRRRD
jgi:amino acid adenylation domain-containing protein